ncbi:MAG TPA: thiamine-phosphate kinase [Burkholderiales bacterium]|nr:thiamine-phosphate kinase [Burkholderiales bacterium]
MSPDKPDLGEFDIIRRFFTRPARHAVLGVGDDAALLRPAPGQDLVAATDMVVAGRHFFPDADPASLGHKVLAVNLSDMAAMGAIPRWATLALALPEADERWLEGFAAGFFALADRHGVDLVGGDTTRGPLNLCVQILGEVPTGQALRRAGARPGDDIWVSGRLGDAALGLAHRQGRLVLAPHQAGPCLRALDWPQPRVELGVRLRGLAHACIDVSDGLLADLGHVLERSRVGATLRLEALPRSETLGLHLPEPAALECLLAGGDDYELLFTAAPANRAAVDLAAVEAGVPVTRIGEIRAGLGLEVLDADGAGVPVARRGFDHFAGGAAP